ncbi:MAG TPA: hypothetical protein VMR86_05210 [Myxococcota bacterium]|nr:hypothetical protein [Myxococcota bacterium]
MSPRKLLSVILLAALPLAGCKVISAIIEIPSDLSAGSSRSIAGSFDAISTSSGSGGKETTPNQTSYRLDLRQYTAAFARQPDGSRDEFVRGISRIAEDHAITHWESEALTPRAIGEGLHDAKLSPGEMDAFVDGIGRDRPEAQLALDGYLHPGS